MKKKLLALVLCCSMVFGLAACGNSKSAAEDTSTIYINLASEPDYLDPTLNSTVDGGCLAVNSFVGLLTYNDQQELVPALASEMPTISEDGLTYTIPMIESKWSNGEELTANDFVYSWNRAAAVETGADYSYLFDIIALNDDGSLAVTADNDYQLTITLTTPCPYFEQLLAFPTFFPVYQESVEAADPDGNNPGAWAQEAGFVCNGAYTLESWSHNESMLYTKNDNYYDAANVKTEHLSFMLSADNTTTYSAYQAGNLDFIDDVPTDEITNVKDNDDFYVEDNLGTYYVAFNVNSDLFSNLTADQANEFREAISILIDRKYIVEQVGQTGQIPAYSFVPVGMEDGNGGTYEATKYYDAETTGPTTENVAKAIELLEDCGYTFTETSEGSGQYTVSPAITLPYVLNENSGHQKAAEIIQQDLATIGIAMDIQVEDWNVFVSDRKAGNFTFAREGWLADYSDPIGMLDLFKSDSDNNDPQFGKDTSNTSAPAWTEYDALIDTIKTTTDLSERVTLMHQAEDILMSTYAVIPIYYYNDIYMQKSNVTGVYATVFGMKYFMYATKTAE